MWRNRNGVYLEPGEVAILADLADRAVPSGPATHPSALMLAALARVLSKMIDGPGVVVAPAPAAIVHQAAMSQVQPAVAFETETQTVRAHPVRGHMA